jgi:phosphatidylethanolamine-binding protein (PEBP) family uncharacterized protein
MHSELCPHFPRYRRARREVHPLAHLRRPGTASGIAEGVPRQQKPDDGSVQGTNGLDVTGYRGPHPQPVRPHSCCFAIHAFDTVLPVGDGVKASRLLQLMEGHVLAAAWLAGTHRR